MIETEIPLKIVDVQGVSNQVLAEDLPTQYCSVLQNLYERRLGELMRKGGTQSITTTFPTQSSVASVLGLDNGMSLRKRMRQRFIFKRSTQTKLILLLVLELRQRPRLSQLPAETGEL